jgi:hypothetical protein
LKNNPSIVLAAVKQNPLALQDASEELKNNRDIVLAAVEKIGLSLKFASDELKHDYHVKIPAVANGWKDGDEGLSTYINGLLTQYRTYLMFLWEWKSNNASLLASSDIDKPTNKLSLLNKLGKYRSIHVKKLIADYVGVYYGERLVTARRALRNALNK